MVGKLIFDALVFIRGGAIILVTMAIALGLPVVVDLTGETSNWLERIFQSNFLLDCFFGASVIMVYCLCWAVAKVTGVGWLIAGVQKAGAPIVFALVLFGIILYRDSTRSRRKAAGR